MDRKVNNRKNASRITGRFIKRLLVMIVCAGIVCAGSLTYLWHWLKIYEERSVNGAMTRYMERVGHHEWHDIYVEDVTYFTELNEEMKYTDYLVWLYGDMNVGGMTFAYAGEDGFSSYYDVYYQQEKICALEVRKPEGELTWKVRTIAGVHEFTFDTLDGATFVINTTPFDEAYVSLTDVLPMAYEDCEYPELLPRVTRYRSGGFISPPNPKPDRSGDIVVFDPMSSHYYIGPAPTKAQIEEFTEEIKETTISYCQYITQDGTFYDLIQHLLPNTDFYYAISGFDSQWFSEHDSIEFRNMEVYDILPMGKNAFIGSISFDYIVTAGELEKTYSSSYQLFFLKDEETDRWLLYKLSIINDTGAQEDAD